MLSILLWVLSTLPTTDDGNRAAAATLVDREECDDDLEFQPYDCPERARWALLTISNRESPNNWSPSRHWVGEHTRHGDNRHSAKLGRKQRERGHFSWWCPAHWGDDGFSTVGPHGLMYAYNVQRLEVTGNCVPWWVLASPMVSARVALSRYVDRCIDSYADYGIEKPKGRGWCPTLTQVVATRDRWDAKAERKRRRERRATCIAERGEARCRLG